MQRSIFLWIFIFPCCFLGSLYGEEAIIWISTGERLILSVSEEQTVLELKYQIEDQLGYPVEEQRLINEGKFINNEEEMDEFLEKEFFLLIGEEEPIAKSQPPQRHYSIPVNETEKKDIHFVVTSLANKPLTKLATKYKPQLEAAGDRLEHVHPLRFFECIFTDDELIVGARNIRKRGWVWDEFKDNSVKRLQQEYERNNLYQFVSDFAKNIQLNESVFLPALQNKQWEGFVNILIQKVPRKGESDRYDQ